MRADVADRVLFLPAVLPVQRPGKFAITPFAFFDAAFKGVGVAQELGYEGVVRLAVECAGVADLFDFAVVHDDDLVGDFQGFFLVVRDQNAGDAQFVVDVAQPGTQFFADFGIECAEGFVQQQQFGFDRKGAGKGDALALAA